MACSGLLKFLTVVFNIAILLPGCMLMGIGGFIVVNSQNILKIPSGVQDSSLELEHLSNTGYTLIAVGAVVTLMSFLGCCGACCESRCMLMTFFILILISFIVEVVAVVLFFYYQPKVEKLLDQIRGKVANSIKQNYGTNDIFTNAWNQTMDDMICCGYNNYTDFTGSPFVIRTSQYPKFCCNKRQDTCNISEASTKNVIGCFDAILKQEKKTSIVLEGVAVCVAAIEVAAMITAFILYKNLQV